jgi:tetratricopeptide (TPR) repeat protein
MKAKLVSIFIILIALAGFFQFKYDSHTDYNKGKSVFVTLPSGNTLKILSFGYKDLVGDLLYIWAIQFYSTYNIDNRFDYLENVFNTISDLCPQYQEVYIVGSWIMALEAENIEMAIRLLDKGSKNIPGEWIFDYESAFYCYRNLKDYDRAVEYLKRAASKPGAPSFIKRRQAHLVYMENDLKKAYAMWVEIYKNAETIIEKDASFKHLYQIKFEMDKQTLEAKIKEYYKKYGRYPSDLTRLVREGLLKEIPLDFTGKSYFYNSKTGKITASRMFKWKKR